MCLAHGTPQAPSQVTVMVLLAAKHCRACGPLQQGWGLPASSSREGCSGADTRCALAGLALASSQLLGLGTARRREQMFGSAPQEQQGSGRPSSCSKQDWRWSLLPSLKRPSLHFGWSRVTPCCVPASP